MDRSSVKATAGRRQGLDLALDRRQCLRGLGATALLSLLHPPSLLATPSASHRARLLEVEVSTSLDLVEMSRFYAGLLGMNELQRTSERLVLAAGQSRIIFRHDRPEVGSEGGGVGEGPTYHFAFNIPPDRIRAARDWQRARTELIVPPERLTDERYPSDVVFFRHWNAHSVFFWDPAGNLVEHIARHTLDFQRGRQGAFSPEEILSVSEIGLVSDDVLATADELREHLDLAFYRKPSASFAALGSEEGLVLVMRRGNPAAFGSGPGREVFPVNVGLDRARQTPYRVQGYPYELRVHLDSGPPCARGMPPRRPS